MKTNNMYICLTCSCIQINVMCVWLVSETQPKEPPRSPWVVVVTLRCYVAATSHGSPF